MVEATVGSTVEATVDQEALDKALDVVNIEFGKGVLEGFTELEIQSIRPMLYELERVAVAVYSKFGGSRSSTIPLTILVEHTEKKCMGRFMAEKLQNREGAPVHQITISMYHLFNQDGTPKPAKEVAEVVTHEVVHLYNFDNKIKDCATGGWHTEPFKEGAEMFGLYVEPLKVENEKGRMVNNKKAVAGHGATKVIEGSELDHFLDRLDLNEDAFNIGCRTFQKTQKARKGNNRVAHVCYCWIINLDKKNDVEYKSWTRNVPQGFVGHKLDTCPRCDTEIMPSTDVDYTALMSWLEDDTNYGEDHPMNNPDD
tara:strand:+ start:1123 stop:2058 length:936 start_codon:yes stop_codon:yes gene_type:complete